MPLIDEVLPVYDVHEVHAVDLRADPERAIAAALSTPVAADRLVSLLFRLRGLRASGTIGELFTKLGFDELARRHGEIVFGGDAKPWRRGTVRIAVDFRSDGRRLTTETRVAASDDAARRSFRRYWRVVGPFSALIRRRWLAQIASHAA